MNTSWKDTSDGKREHPAVNAENVISLNRDGKR